MNKHDPEYQQNRRDAHWRLDAEHLRYIRKGGQEGIGEATYLRSLMIIGYSPSEARTELALLKMAGDYLLPKLPGQCER